VPPTNAIPPTVTHKRFYFQQNTKSYQFWVQNKSPGRADTVYL